MLINLSARIRPNHKKFDPSLSMNILVCFESHSRPHYVHEIERCSLGVTNKHFFFFFKVQHPVHFYPILFWTHLFEYNDMSTTTPFSSIRRTMLSRGLFKKLQSRILYHSRRLWPLLSGYTGCLDASIRLSHYNIVVWIQLKLKNSSIILLEAEKC